MLSSSWSLSRIVTIFVGLAFILISIQVVLFHYRQNFRSPVMWGPVIEPPIAGIFAIIVGIFNLSSMKTLLAILYAITALVGIIGFYFHFTGVGDRVDGYKLQNFLVGPPIILPPMFTALSILGLMALYWGNK